MSYFVILNVLIICKESEKRILAVSLLLTRVWFVELEALEKYNKNTNCYKRQELLVFFVVVDLVQSSDFLNALRILIDFQRSREYKFLLFSCICIHNLFDL